MIKSLVPYKLSVSFVSPLTAAVCTSFTVNVRVWDGAKGSPPSPVNYAFTIGNPTTSSATVKKNISRILNDFLDFTPYGNSATGLINGSNQRWVKTTVIYTTANPSDLNVEQSASTQLMTKGYSYGMGGENESTPANRILLSGTEFKVNRTGNFVLPVLIEEETP